MVCFFIRLNPDRVIVVKSLFGLPDDIGSADGVSEENLKCIHELISVLRTIAEDHVADSEIQIPLYQVQLI